MPTSCPERKAQSAPKKDDQASKSKATSIFHESDILIPLKIADKKIKDTKEIKPIPQIISSMRQKVS
jgi:hypothetical protein